MRRYDVCPLRSRTEQLVVVLQDDLADTLATRVVAPLSESREGMIGGLRFPVEIGRGAYMVQIDRLAAIARSELGPPVGTIEAEERRIKAALDLLFFGV